MTVGEIKILIRSYLDGNISRDDLRELLPVDPAGDRPAEMLYNAVMTSLVDRFRLEHNTGVSIERREHWLRKDFQRFLDTDWVELSYFAIGCFWCETCNSVARINYDTRNPPRHCSTCGGKFN